MSCSTSSPSDKNGAVRLMNLMLFVFKNMQNRCFDSTWVCSRFRRSSPLLSTMMMMGYRAEELISMAASPRSPTVFGGEKSKKVI